VTVTESNQYGSTTISKPIDLGTSPVSGGTISGPSNVAENSTNITYSVPNNSGSAYNWTVPAGAVITSGQGTNSITVDFGTSSGTVIVDETNAYGSGSSGKAISVGAVPASSPVTGQDTVSYGQSGVTYSVPANPAVSFAWVVPSGAAIVSGQGTNSIVVNFGSSGGNVTVTRSNAYGSNNSSLLVVAGPIPTVSSIVGSTSVSQGQTYTYSVNNDPTLSYNWSVPSGATIVSGQGTNTITVSYGPSAVNGNVSVTGTNAYGTTSVNSVISMSATGIFNSYASDPSSVYPNPFQNEVTIRINSGEQTDLSIRVTDLKGMEVYTSSGYFTNQDIVLGSELKSGLYIVRASYGNKMSLIKVTKIE
jgi:hypothetical protein